MKIPLVVVDDDETDRYLVKRAAQSLNYDFEIIEFETGSLFVETVLDPEKRVASLGVPPPPILVLLDINMPRMSGFEVLEALKDVVTDGDQLIIVTMYSSSNHGEDRTDAMNYEFVDDYVVKPISAERLKSLVSKFCGPQT